MSVESSGTRAGKSRGGRPIYTNLILAVALFAICGLAYWLETQRRGGPMRDFDNKPHLVNIESNQEIESLQIVDKEKAIDYLLKCTDHCKLNDPASQWDIVSPISFKAESANVGSFISGLMATSVQDSIPVENMGTGDADNALRPFGLEKAKREGRRAIFKLKKDPEPYTVFIGDGSAVGENVYALAGGPSLKMDSVKIISSSARVNLQRSLSYWRAKKLFDFAASEIESFRLTNAKGTVELARDGQEWRLDPGKQLADNEAVDTYVTGLAFTNAHDYVSDDKVKDAPKLGITPQTAHYTLALKVAKKPELRVEIYDFAKDNEPKLYAMRSDKNFVVSLDRPMADKFIKSRDDFRFHRLLTAAEKEQVKQIEVRVGGKDQLEFKRGDSAWELAAGTVDKFDPSTVDQALTRIGSIRVLEFDVKIPAPKETPELSYWRLKGKDGKILRELTVYGSAPRGEYFAKLGDGKTNKLDRLTAGLVPFKIEGFQRVIPLPAMPGAPGKNK